MTKKYCQILLCIIAGAVLSFMALLPVRPAVAQDYPETTPTGTPVIPPQFYLSPWEGNRGTWIRINGSVFTPNSIVKFYFSSDAGGTSSSIDTQIKAYKYLGPVWTTGGGFIDNSVAPGNQAVYQVPSKLNDGTSKKTVPDGTCYIYATYSNSKNVIALAKFTVTTAATIVITPGNGLVGDSINITGKGLGGDEKVTAKYDERDVAIKEGNPKTTATGEFQGTIQIPDSADGKHTISITDETGNSPKGNFTVSSSIALSPATQAVGGKVIVNGTGFGARKPVSISFNGLELTPEEAPLSTTQYGSFQATVIVPFDFNYLNGGKVTVAVSSLTSAASSELTILATAPVIKLTSETGTTPGYAGMPTTVSGMWFTPGDKVNITIDDAVVPVATAIVNDNRSFSVAFVLPSARSGVHRVTAAGAKTSATTTYLMESEAPLVPVLESPRITGTSGEAPQLAWSAVSDPSGVTYDLEVAGDSTFNKMFVEKRGLSSTKYTFTAAESARLNRGSAPCYWRVRAVDGAQNESEWTPASPFFVGFSWVNMPSWAEYTLGGLGIVILLVIYLFLRKRAAFKKGYGAI